MANFCLVPEAVNRFKQGFANGLIDPYKLNKMTSEERRAIFEKIAGKDAAREVNARFESKMLLKNQKYAYTAWAKQVAGITPEVRRDIITRIGKIDHILNPTEEKGFLRDLASTKLGVDVSQEEAKTISDLSNKVSQTKTAMQNGGDRLEYGRAKVALGNYVNDLKIRAEKPSVKQIVTSPSKALTNTAGIAKSLKASLDTSALFRQGWKTLFTNPVIWQANARKSFGDIVKEFGGKQVMDETNADIVSRANYERYRKGGLAVSNIEEYFPSHSPGKIPILGRAYRASESAYTGFLYRQRADIFDKYLDIAKKSGVNIDDVKELKATAKLVNSLTGRGHLGGLEPAANTVNSVFFSPRSLKSNIDTLTAHQFQKNITPFARKQAALATAKVIAGTAAVMALAEALKPGSVEFDPRSSDFGKIKIGDTRFDVSGGQAVIATLASRIVKQSTKSSSTGKISKLNSGFGSSTGADVVSQFFQNKLSPAASVVKDLVSQKDFNGSKPTPKGEAGNLLVPLPITNIQELRSDPNSANNLLASVADGLGIVTNTYGNTPTKTLGVTKSVSQALTDAQFSLTKPQPTQRGKTLNPTQYKAFSNESNNLFINSVNKAMKDPAYQKLSATDKNKTLTSSLSRARKTALVDTLGSLPKQKTTHLRKY